MNTGSRLAAGALSFSMILLAGCASDPPQTGASAPSAAPVTSSKPAAQRPPQAAAAPGSTAARPQSAAPGRGGAAPTDPFSDPRNLLSKRSVYYDYDDSSVKTEYRPVVEAHAAYLRGNPSARIDIEGNCDERGSREYNLALGQRRADSVKSLLVVMGVQAARIETTSYGEEKPAAPGHEETAWSKNRRSDIVYKRK